MCIQMASSFRKATKGKVPDVTGTRISVENSQLLISTGAPDFDSVIVEDPSGSYAKLLSKLFLAEGIAVGHPLFVASKTMDPGQLVREMPSPVSNTSHEKIKIPQEPEKDSDLKIAWRYQNIPTTGQESRLPTLQFGHHFDLSRTVDPEIIQVSKPTLWSDIDTKIESKYEHLPAFYSSLLSSINETISVQSCWVSGPAKPADQQRPHTVLRLVIHSLGSPQWTQEASHLPAMLYAIRAIVRAACAVCLITLPAHLLEDVVVARCCHLADYCVQPSPAHHIEGKVAPLLSGMDGVFRILHLAAINTLMPFKPATLDLGFKVRRKKFSIEKLQLPPELTESAEREQDDVGAPSGVVGCGSARSTKLDF
ncbi:hypothetical protein B566_EDAN017583 [Ephemera danica]|nr:hypothetical protein B566_EDAN017583 [Ephemera danica]